MKAIVRPSGDHLEARSWTPGVRVRLRVLPFLAGTVRRRRGRRRGPAGRRGDLVVRDPVADLDHLAAAEAMSSAMITGTRAVFSVARSKV